MTEKTMEVPAELLRAIAEYLSMRPHREVDALLRGLDAAARAAAQRRGQGWPPAHAGEAQSGPKAGES
ncbi:MAG: hypothetical protein KGH75_01010 [Rhodospirillales bacterium]|nr:hypothetical protein [Rhodospirillales bacterium]